MKTDREGRRPTPPPAPRSGGKDGFKRKIKNPVTDREKEYSQTIALEHVAFYSRTQPDYGKQPLVKEIANNLDTQMEKLPVLWEKLKERSAWVERNSVILPLLTECVQLSKSSFEKVSNEIYRLGVGVHRYTYELSIDEQPTISQLFTEMDAIIEALSIVYGMLSEYLRKYENREFKLEHLINLGRIKKGYEELEEGMEQMEKIIKLYSFYSFQKAGFIVTCALKFIKRARDNLRRGGKGRETTGGPKYNLQLSAQHAKYISRFREKFLGEIGEEGGRNVSPGVLIPSGSLGKIKQGKGEFRIGRPMTSRNHSSRKKERYRSIDH